MKRAQASVFLVIAAIIVLTASLLYFGQSDSLDEIAPSIQLPAQNIPSELDPVNAFVTNCLEDVASTGLRLLGEHGGYIDPRDQSLTRKNFDVNVNPTESDLLLYKPGTPDTMAVPYWYHLRSDNECTGSCEFTTQQPPLRQTDPNDFSIQSQLNRYIERELIGCFDNFEALERQGFSVSAPDAPEVQSTIANEDVVILIDYPVSVTGAGADSEIEQFFVRLDVDLEGLYNLGNKLVEINEELRLFEQQTIELLSIFGGTESTNLPPLSETELQVNQVRWQKNDIREKVQGFIRDFTGMNQVVVSNNWQRLSFPTSGFDDTLNAKFVFPIFEPDDVVIDTRDLNAKFYYLDWWPIHFDLNCDGQNCEPERFSLLFIDFTRYNFLYDISHPIMIELSDPDAFNGRGYRFQFAVESNVRNNEPMESDFSPIVADPADVDDTLICSSYNRASGQVQVNVVDSITGQGVDDVSIFFGDDAEQCAIATTENGQATEQFPTGTIGASMLFRSQEYLDKTISKDFAVGVDDSVQVELDPIISKNIVVKTKKVAYTQLGWTMNNPSAEFDLGQLETAFVNIERIGAAGEEEHSTFANIIPADPEQSFGTVDLAPGRYKLSIQVMNEDELIIPRDQRTENGERFFVPEEDLVMQPYMSGGTEIEFTVSKIALEQADTLTVYAIIPAIMDVPAVDRKMELLEGVYQIDEYSEQFRSSIEPQWN